MCLYVTALGVYEVEINGGRRRPRAGARLDELPPPPALPDLRRDRPAARGRQRDRRDRGRRLVPRPARLRRRAAQHLRRPARAARPARDRLRRRHDGASSSPTTRWRAATGPILAADIYDGETYDARLERAGLGGARLRRRGWRRSTRSSATSRTLVAPTGPAGAPHRGARAGGDQPPRRPARTIVDFGQNLVGRLRITVAGERGHDDHAAPRRGARGRRARASGRCAAPRRPTATRCAAAAARPGSRASPSTASATPRSTAGRASSTRTTLEAVVCHSDLDAHRLVRVLRPAASTSCTRTSSGACAATSSTCRPTARSATSGWAGPATSRCSRRPRRSCTTAPASSRSWLADLAAEQQAPTGACRSSSRTCSTPARVPRPTPPRLGRRGGRSCRGRCTSATATAACSRAQYDEHARLGGPGRRARRRRAALGRRASSSATGSTRPRRRTDPAAARTDPRPRRDRLLRALRRAARRRPPTCSGDADDAAALRRPGRAEVRDAFAAEYVTPDGRLIERRADRLRAGARVRPAADERSARARRPSAWPSSSRADGYRIGTGFVGTPLICDALCAASATCDAAYRLLLQRECPSWLYPVTMGATTIWERWDSLLPDGTVNPGEMTSFNHYAFGAVADWLHHLVAGLAPDGPGSGLMRIAPEPARPAIDSAASTARPITGPRNRAGRSATIGFKLEAVVPPNTRGNVLVPGETSHRDVGSGRHVWTARIPPSGSSGGCRLADRAERAAHDAVRRLPRARGHGRHRERRHEDHDDRIV